MHPPLVYYYYYYLLLYIFIWVGHAHALLVNSQWTADHLESRGGTGMVVYRSPTRGHCSHPGPRQPSRSLYQRYQLRKRCCHQCASKRDIDEPRPRGAGTECVLCYH